MIRIKRTVQTQLAQVFARLSPFARQSLFSINHSVQVSFFSEVNAMRQAEEMARKRGREGEETLLTAGGVPAGGQMIGFVAGYALHSLVSLSAVVFSPLSDVRQNRFGG